MLQPPEHSLSLIVKGCFDLVSGGKAVFTQDSDAATIVGDVFVADEPTASLEYANDLVIYKPKADLTLSGVAYPECGKAGCQVSFGVGQWRKSLAIFNDRFWRWGNASAPEPFASDTSHAMPLIYENAYGGENYGFNPVGKGASKICSKNGENVQPLPNVEHINSFISSPSQKTLPAGFGPLKDGWGDKIPLTGTYGDKWLKENFPYFPNDFDWGYFNNAPQDQQVEFLVGDESLYFENLRPELPIFESQLPAVRPRLFVKGELAEQEFFHEVTLRLDTLHVDMEKQQVNLVWRGVVGVQSDEYEELAHACLFVEELAAEKLSSKHYLQRFDAAQQAQDQEFEVEAFEDEQGQDLVIEEVTPEVELTQEVEVVDQDTVELDALFAKLKTQLREAGVAEHLLDMFTPDADMDLFNQKVFENYNIPMADGNKLIEKSQLDMNKLMVEQGHDPIDFTEQTKEPELSLDADISKVELTEREQMDKLLVENTDFEGMDLTGLDFSHRDLSNKSFQNTDLTKADLSGANLSGCDFSGADMSHCSMGGTTANGAIFSEAILDGVSGSKVSFINIRASFAQFQNAKLVKANFEGADLTSADFTKSVLANALFNECSMQGTIFENADISQGQFINVEGKAADFDGTNLRESLFENCKFAETNFSSSRLTLAVFENSDLTEATMETVDAESVVFRKCTLDQVRAGEQSYFCGATFAEGSALDTIFEGADLSNATFTLLPLLSADFSGTDLTMASFSQCEMNKTDFSKALVTDTKLSGVNLFEASFAKAKLTRADLSLSNLYGAEFFQAELHQTNLQGSNITQTKIELGMVKQHG